MGACNGVNRILVGSGVGCRVTSSTEPSVGVGARAGRSQIGVGDWVGGSAGRSKVSVESGAAVVVQVRCCIRVGDGSGLTRVALGLASASSR